MKLLELGDVLTAYAKLRHDLPSMTKPRDLPKFVIDITGSFFGEPLTAITKAALERRSEYRRTIATQAITTMVFGILLLARSFEVSPDDIYAELDRRSREKLR